MIENDTHTKESNKNPVFFSVALFCLKSQVSQFAATWCVYNYLVCENNGSHGKLWRPVEKKKNKTKTHWMLFLFE